MERINRHFCMCIVWACTALCGNRLLLAENEIDLFFSGLRERGLFIIAEDYALSRLEAADLLPDDRARLTIELTRTLIDHGALASAQQRQELWDEAQRILQDFADDHPRNPRRLAVRAELAMLPAKFAQTLAWEHEINPANRAALQAATTQYETAVQSLTQLLSEINANNNSPSQQELADGALSSHDVDLLAQEMQYLVGTARFFLSRFAPAGPNRASWLLDAQSGLEKLSGDRNESIWTVKAKRFRAHMARLAKDSRKASSLLRSIEDDAADFGLQDDVLAEKVRVSFADGKIDDGLQLIVDRIHNGPPISDELRAVAVTGLLTAWKIAGEKQQPELQQELFAQALSHHERTLGKWHQLTHFQIQQVQQELEIGEELAAIVQEAHWTYQQGDVETAIDSFGSAAAVAHRQNKPELAIQYALTRGSIQVQSKDWNAAEETYRQIVDQYPSQPKAADAGLMRCYCLGRIFIESPTQESRLNYEQALSEHRKTFSETPSASEATWMLATHQDQRLQWTDAVDLYREIPKTHARFDAATLRIVILYDKILTRLKELGGPVEVWEDQLLEEIVRIEDALPQSAALKSIDQCQASLRIAQLLLQHRERWYQVADFWLKRVEQTADFFETEARNHQQPFDEQWTQLRRAASQLRIVSLAGQQRLGDAREIMLKLEKTDPSTMLGILLGLTELTEKVDPRNKVELGHLQVEAIERLSRSRGALTPQQQRLLDDCHAEALIAIGNLFEAGDIYDSLIEKSPRDERLIRKAIAVRLQRGKLEDLKKARHSWTRIERLHPAGHVTWVEARLNIARLDSRMGEADQARKLLGVTKTLYPKLGNPTLKSEVEQLLGELNASTR